MITALCRTVQRAHDDAGNCCCPGPVCHDRRQSLLGCCHYRSPKAGRPDVDITYCGRSSYWMVDIKCKDRTKLLFDTVCTLADCGYDVFHATIDSEGGFAHQEVRDWFVWWIASSTCALTSCEHLWMQPQSGSTRFVQALHATSDALTLSHIIPWLWPLPTWPLLAVLCAAARRGAGLRRVAGGAAACDGGGVGAAAAPQGAEGPRAQRRPLRLPGRAHAGAEGRQPLRHPRKGAPPRGCWDAACSHALLATQRLQYLLLTWSALPQVKTYAVNNSSGHTFYVMNADGSAPDRANVEEACSAIGGRLVDIGCDLKLASSACPICSKAQEATWQHLQHDGSWHHLQLVSCMLNLQGGGQQLQPDGERQPRQQGCPGRAAQVQLLYLVTPVADQLAGVAWWLVRQPA